MDMNGCKDIFRVSIDVSLHSCRELECLDEGDEFGLLCRSSDQQWVGFSD
jgi:hypothetical protein